MLSFLYRENEKAVGGVEICPVVEDGEQFIRFRKAKSNFRVPVVMLEKVLEHGKNDVFSPKEKSVVGPLNG